MDHAAATGEIDSDFVASKLAFGGHGLRNISKRWTLPIRGWKAALNRFTIQFEERIPQL